MGHAAASSFLPDPDGIKINIGRLRRNKEVLSKRSDLAAPRIGDGLLYVAFLGAMGHDVL